MNKKILFIILVILALAIIVSAFWYAENNQKLKTQNDVEKVANNNQQQNKQKQGEQKNQQTKNDSKEENNQEQKNNQEQSGKHFKQLSPEEIEKLKKEKNLVWYEIPELNIKFLVTRDTKEDLGYSYKTFQGYRKKEKYLNIKDAILYSKSETDKDLSGCTISEETGWSCGWIQINTVLDKELKNYDDSKEWCNNPTFLKFNIKDIEGCIVRSSQYVILDNDYKKFFHIINKSNKTFGIYLNTIQPIK